ncbi:probable methyltransferase PMT3 isoform X2 [Abrus precatorius]|uniref:Methyltransferase n=1 Tax=Abrus precatorius TaxID=3816 RepID=A0A8B8L0Q9_ABRPR|nr:probable methyltransferase PMT3 isoform X2 [Abrus precatorius]
MTRGRPDVKSRKRLFTTVLVLVIIGAFLYFYSYSDSPPVEYGSKSSSHLRGNKDDDESSPLLGGVEDSAIPKSIPVCDDRLSELIPCLDRNLIYQTRLKLDLSLMEHYERHCPIPERRYNCLIPPTPGYKMLNFPNNNINNGGRIRTVFDVGCGVASFGGYLLSSNVIAMSLAPNDGHENQIQFALERGIPAYLGVLGTLRLPYPSRSFEFAHCSRCRIDWLQRDGLLLLELDRILRPGGYFAYSSPEAYAQDEEDRRIWREMSALVERMCWKIAAKRNQTVIWVKPLTNSCYLKREPGTQPPLCRYDDDPDAVWGVKMKACISRYSDQMHKAKGSGLSPWPARLTTPPPRLAEINYSAEMFKEDMEVWKERVHNYWSKLGSRIKADTIRNVMDMKANLGSFAAALKDKDVWVMNVVPENGSNTLKIVYDRGLIGTTHNWCEAFSTYPRTYDLLHAWTVFSDIIKKECSPEDLLIEMDRILRPKGFIIVHDKRSVVDYIKKYLPALHWEAVTIYNVDQGKDDAVFIIQKKMWLTSGSIRVSESESE